MPAQKCLRMNNEEGLFPGPNYPGQQHQEKPIGLPAGRSFDVPMRDDELLTQQRVFGKQFGLPFGKVFYRSKQKEVEWGFIPRTMPS